MSYRPMRCLTARQLRDVPRAQVERWLASTKAAESALNTLIGMGCNAPTYLNDRAICEHNRRLLTRHVSATSACRQADEA